MKDLHRLTPALNHYGLVQALSGSRSPTTVPVDESADLSRIRDAINALSSDTSSQLASQTDAALAPVVHQALRHLPRRLLLDMAFWQWLTVVEFSDYTLRRWAPGAVITAESDLSGGLVGRFLGRQNLVGVARNALARLYWCVETLDDESSDYDLTKRMLARQDLFVGVFEREIGLVPAVARACARTLPDLNENERRLALRRLLLRGSSLTLDDATEDQVQELLVG